MSYDPDERRDTPLALKLKERIARDGPIPVADYVRTCLLDAEHGYYRTQPAIGAGADFVTAPEISQIFGELIGLWCAVAWHEMGRPDPIHIVELGPGRGTMMSDMLRALKAEPRLLEALRVHMIEPSARLAGVQQAALAAAGVPMAWWNDVGEVPRAPSLLVANEYLDAAVFVRQLVRTAAGWATRGVGLDERRNLGFVALDGRCDDDVPREMREAPPGTVLEIADCDAITADLHLLARNALAALFVDYGYVGPATGDTLQAVRRHRPEHPLCSPGEADLTVHVDFTRFAASVRRAGLLADGPVTQAEFLGALGIVERASRLMAANPAHAAAIETAVARLIAPGAMGVHFKAMGVRSPGLPPFPGFASLTDSG